MNEVDSGRVVFFCGSGVSAGEGSELPDFAKLVSHVYTERREVPDPVEREALHCDVEDENLRRPQLDKALGLLERPERLGPQVLRGTVIERLTKPRTGPLPVHKALLTLSRNERGTRLVTTNFDNRFVEAGLSERFVDAAPKLPVPKRHNWSSLVHLHGRIDHEPGDDGSNLVLTAADFGRAYLTERWAARFVTELFREFTVIFVGYSVADPVMSYLVDALAAERAKGARFENAYAFAEYDGTPEGLQKTHDRWRAKNVEPVLYDNGERNHRLFAETLIEWARIQTDPFQARSQIALSGISKLPGGPNDPVRERVVWALEEPGAAEAFAAVPAIVDEDEFPKIERWLDAFQEVGLLRFAATDALPEAGEQGPAFVRLVDSGYLPLNPHALDATRRCLAHWIARHAHVPQVLAWALRNGGRMHRGLREKIQIQLGHPEVEIPPRLRLLWTILSNYEPMDHQRFLWSAHHLRWAGSDAERERIEDEAIASMAPRLIVVPGPTSHMGLARLWAGETGPIPPIDACGHPKLIVSNEESLHSTRKIVSRPDVLSRHAATLTGFLEQALKLGEEDEEIYSDSSFYRPSIAEHDQNRHSLRVALDPLIDLVRDSYQELAAKDRARADNLLRRWALSGRPLFARLALHALTEDPKSDIRLAKNLLVSGRRPGVWNWELQRELLRFFRLVGARLPQSLRVDVVRAIHADPKPKPRRLPPNYPAWIRRERALRLHKLVVSGARLDKRSRTLAEVLEPPEPGVDEERNEFTVWREGARWIGDEEFAPRDLRDGPAADIVAAIRDENIRPDEFRGLASTQPEKSREALEQLGAEGWWPPVFWQQFLWSIPGPPDEPGADTGLHEEVARILSDAPDELYEEIGSAFADLVKGLANAYEGDREPEFAVLWARAWRIPGRRAPPELAVAEEPLDQALNDPAGKLADAALARLSKHQPQIGEGLPEPLRPYFDAVARDPGGHLGRVILATRLYYLFAIDPEWVQERLIPLLDPEEAREAPDLWYAYGWSRTIGPNLLHVLKGSFLEVLRGGEMTPRAEHNLTLLFMTICLEAPNELTNEEVQGVMDAMSEEALKTVLASLRDRLKGEPAERAQIWNERVQLWLQAFWPEPPVRNTAGVSKALVELVAESGDAFREAAVWSLGYLQPMEGDLFRLMESGHARQHPASTLDILATVVRPDGLPRQHRPTLREVLNEMREAMPEVERDPRFQSLFRNAAQ